MLSRLQLQSENGRVVSVKMGDIELTEKASIRRVTFDARANEVPTVYLETINDGVIDVDGIVVHNVGATDGPAVATWLRAIDPSALEKEVLRRADYGESITSLTLRVLAEWAERG